MSMQQSSPVRAGIERLPGHVEVEVEVPVRAERGTAFAAMTQWDQQHRWMLGSRVWSSLGDGSSVGDELSCWTGFGRLGFLDTMTITEPGDAWVVVEHTGRVVRGVGWMGVPPTPGEGPSTFVWGESVRPPLGILGRAGWVVVGPLLRLAVQYSLRRLAGLVESGQLPR